MKNTTGFLSAEYTEPKSDTTFKGLIVTITNHETKEKRKIEFITGDAIYDFYAYTRWMINNNELAMITHSSSVDHFYMDTEKYIEKHIIFNEDATEGELMWWKDAERLGHDVDKLITACCDKKMKKFSELKSYIKQIEKERNITINKDFTIVIN